MWYLISLFSLQLQLHQECTTIYRHVLVPVLYSLSLALLDPQFYFNHHLIIHSFSHSLTQSFIQSSLSPDAPVSAPCMNLQSWFYWAPIHNSTYQELAYFLLLILSKTTSWVLWIKKLMSPSVIFYKNATMNHIFWL